MKPLVYWCRWHEARLLLHGRSPTAVWGHLAFADHHEPFHFGLQTQQLTLGLDGEQRIVQLDEMGIEIQPIQEGSE